MYRLLLPFLLIATKYKTYNCYFDGTKAGLRGGQGGAAAPGPSKVPYGWGA